MARTIAESNTRELVSFDIATGDSTPLIPAGAVNYDDALPTFSVDGSSVAFVRTLPDDSGNTSSIMELNLERGGIGMLAREVASGSSFVTGPLLRLPNDGLVYAVDWDPERAIDRKPGIWYLEPGEAPQQILEADAQSDHPHPVVLDAYVNGDLVFVIATDAESQAVTPLTNASTWIAFEGETVLPLEREPFDTVPSPTTIVTTAPDREIILTLTWKDDTLVVGVMSEEGYSELAATGWLPIASNATYVHASWAGSHRVFLGAFDTPGLLLDLTGPSPTEATPEPECGCSLEPADG